MSPLLWHFAIAPLCYAFYSPGPSTPHARSILPPPSLCPRICSGAIWLYLPSPCICLSLSEVWETGVRGPCQTNQQYSLIAIPLCIWLCTGRSVSSTTDTECVCTHKTALSTAKEHVMCAIRAKMTLQTLQTFITCQDWYWTITSNSSYDCLYIIH